MKKINENQKVTLTLRQLKHLVNEAANDSDFEIKDGVLVKYNGSGGDVVIPHGVTSIGKRAFFDRRDITSVTIPDSVTIIGQDAFRWCKGLKSVTIPDSVTNIEPFAFEDCTSLASLIIPDSVTRIGWAAFSSNIHLKSVTIGNSLTDIESSAFADCYDLNEVTIPNSVTRIGESAFLSCSSLKSITIPDSVTSIGEAAFAGCWGLTSVAIPDSVTEMKQGAFAGCSGLKSVEISNSLKWIPHFAFQGCDGLVSVTIPNSVEKIGVNAFEDCKNLKSVVVPDSVTSIGEKAFNNCKSLVDVKIDNPDLLDDIKKYPEESFEGTPWGEMVEPGLVKENKMKRINENTKITMTIGQLKRLVNEGTMYGFGSDDAQNPQKTLDNPKDAIAVFSEENKVSPSAIVSFHMIFADGDKTDLFVDDNTISNHFFDMQKHQMNPKYTYFWQVKSFLIGDCMKDDFLKCKVSDKTFDSLKFKNVLLTGFPHDPENRIKRIDVNFDVISEGKDLTDWWENEPITQKLNIKDDYDKLNDFCEFVMNATKSDEFNPRMSKKEFYKQLNAWRKSGSSATNVSVNENQKVTLTIGQLKRLI